MQMPDNREKKLLTYIGFASRSRNTAVGTDLALNAVRKAPGKVCVVSASDASDRTKKQIRDKCLFYKTAHFEPNITSEELAKATGKASAVAAVAVTDKGLADAIAVLYSETDGSETK